VLSPRVRRLALGAATTAVVSLTAACSSTAECWPLPEVAGHASAAPPAGYPFGPTSVWRTPARSAPVAEDSEAVVRYLASTVTDRYGGVAAFNARRFANNFYRADPGTPRVDVAFDDCQDKGYLPTGLTGPDGQFTGVPIPSGAVGAAGTDKMLSVYSADTDQLWELWVAEQGADGRWSACWGGRIDDVSTSAGFFTPPYGATASGLSSTGGMVSLADVRSGRIDHALSLVVPNTAAGRMSWPAQRNDGWDTHPDAVPEGTRLRLDPAVDVDALELEPVATMIAKAAQEYGFLVADTGGSVAVIAEGGAADPVTGRDPWDDVLQGVPTHRVLEDFPWEQLQVLPADYGKPGAAPRCDG
jgi:hypothetical protein